MNRWLSFIVHGSGVWPKKEQEFIFRGKKLFLRPCTRDTEQSIHILLDGISHVQGHTLINRFLSILSWCDDEGLKIDVGVSGSPEPTPIPRDNSRSIGSSIAFPSYFKNEGENPRTELALALYREALTAESVPLSFLSYFKILNIFWKEKYQKNGKNEIIEGIRESIQLVSDERAKSRIQTLDSENVDVPTYLYKQGRCAIAHAYSKPIVDPDDISDSHRLSEDIWIIKAIADYLMENELKISRSIFW